MTSISRSLAFAVLVVASVHVSRSLPGQTSPDHHDPTVFARVLALHRALVRGDVQAVRSSAAWLAEHGPMRAAPPETRDLNSSLQTAAARAAAATDLERAAPAIADAIAACGACHRAAHVAPTLPAIEPSRQTSIVGHMQRHAQAAEELLHGMVIPSDRLWLQGTTAFAEEPLQEGDFPVDFERGAAMAQVEADVHRLAQNAFSADTTASRALAYRQLLGTCAACHRQHAQP